MNSAKTVVFVSGNFYSLHPGHVRLLKFAAECGDVLVVGVSKLRPAPEVPTPEERAEALRELGLVDRVVVMADGVESYIRELRPDIIVKGKEFESADNPEAPIIAEYGGRLLFSSGESSYSGSDLLVHEPITRPRAQMRIPQDFLRRHKLSEAEMSSRVSAFAKLKVIVVGDLIVDEYVNCEALGMSREDPTLVVSPQSIDRFIGGAGIVAAHAAALGASVQYFTVIGSDPVGDDAMKRLGDYNVAVSASKDDSRPTTLKQRFRAQDKTMLRVSHLRQHEISRDLQEKLTREFVSACRKAQLVIFSDFSYGCLPQPLVDRLTAAARDAGAMIAADSQSSSQVGDISRFRNADLLTPTEHEVRLALRDQSSGLAQVGSELLVASGGKNAFVTLGAAGALIIKGQAAGQEMQVDRLPALNPLPRDISGAGDSMLTAGALAMAAGASTWEAAFLGSMAAGIQITRVGNRPISAVELTDALLP